MSSPDTTAGPVAPPDGPVIIGLTGPIGCGKSTIAAMLAELGGVVIDADALARQVTAPGQPALTAIRGRFGDGEWCSFFSRRGGILLQRVARPA